MILASLKPFDVQLFINEGTTAYNCASPRFLLHQIQSTVMTSILEDLNLSFSATQSYLGTISTGNSTLLRDLNRYMVGKVIYLNDIICKHRLTSPSDTAASAVSIQLAGMIKTLRSCEPYLEGLTNTSAKYALIDVLAPGPL